MVKDLIRHLPTLTVITAMDVLPGSMLMINDPGEDGFLLSNPLPGIFGGDWRRINVLCLGKYITEDDPDMVTLLLLTRDNIVKTTMCHEECDVTVVIDVQ